MPQLDDAQVRKGLYCVSAVLKVASRCNLNCSYCYVYNKGDDSWRGQPAVMSEPTVLKLLERVRAHCAAHAIGSFEFVLHGGEPLLAGPRFVESFVRSARDRLEPDVAPTFTIQTNGALLTTAWAQLLSRLDVKVGLSVDPTPQSHDRARVDHRGRGSYAAAILGLAAAQRQGLDPGLLCVVDIEEAPSAVLQHFRTLAPRSVDFLLPLATWDSPPPRRTPTSYADWLIEFFDLWIADPTPPFRIRLFEHIARTVLGFPSSYDALGPGVSRTVVIETDGSLESLDVLSVCENGLASRGYSVHDHSIDEALSDALAQSYVLASRRLSQTCRGCRLNDICGGGYLPHRYGRGRQFDNESVYCPDLFELIRHIQSWVVEALPDEIRREHKLVPIAP